MKGIIDITVRLIWAGKRAYARKWSFLGLFAILFIGSSIVLSNLDLLPDAPVASAAPVVALTVSQLDAATTSVAVASAPELPTQVVIPAINLSVTVADPDTTDTDVLDGDLLKGAVRYPTSAELGEDGNVVIFGHSSYLPIVKNQAYKTFDGIQKLAAGDVITVYSATTAYTYAVRNVAKESANDAAIPLQVSGKVLTLSTCNSFGEKTDRFVVTADFVQSQPI
jgi:LPXTG-site transpeptidase (sortase) family protein